MLNSKRAVSISKFLSQHLRHAPEELGLTLQPGGWVQVADLLAACNRHGHPITQDELEAVVRTSDKQRFAFDETGERIRANQGHSVDVDLQLSPTEPPAVLYHGTPSQFEEAIRTAGLKKMARHHVHLSPDIPTARKVGQRHGKPAVFAIDAAAMRAEGRLFYCSANGVWLTDEVPPRFLGVVNDG
jgi:putative RNA 2'-phosphotransferase